MSTRLRCTSLLLCALVLIAPHALVAQPAPTGQSQVFARVQLIHNVADAGPLDVYVDGTLWLDDRTFQTATAFEVFPDGQHRIDVVAGDAPDNSAPLWSGDALFLHGVRYVIAVQGRTSNVQAVIQDQVRPASLSDNVEFFIIHGSPDTGLLDVRRLDPVNQNAVLDLLENNLAFGEVGIYRSLPAAGYSFEVTNDDNSASLAVFWINLHFFGGATLVFLSSGLGTETPGFRLIGFDVDGNLLLPSVITATEEETGTPSTFALDGNYPNPFNPATQIRYALSRAAAVRLVVYDALGRRVRTLVQAEQPAGSYTVAWDGRNEAGAPAPSGVYLYRLEAGGFVKARTMLLAK